MIGILTAVGALTIFTAMAISGFVAAESPRALVRVRNR
ncbi:MAG: hypothetical protein JWN03_5089 [Nocardia sp.]|nr:hypothetical protein [Nocardia sp.]